MDTLVTMSRRSDGLRRGHGGSAIVMFSGVLIIFLMISAICIDLGVAFGFQNKLQSVTDAAALAGAQKLLSSTATNSRTRQNDAIQAVQAIVTSNNNVSERIALDPNRDIQFGYIDPSTRNYDPTTFRTPTSSNSFQPSGGYNAVRVSIRKTADSPAGTLPTVMGRMLGVDSMSPAAESVAMMLTGFDTVTGGLRPFYGCWAQYQQALADGNLRNNTARIYGALTLDGNNVAGCPAYTPGNWGFADLRDGNQGSPGTSTVRNWIQYGFNSANGQGQLPVGENEVSQTKWYNLSVQTGNPISAVSTEIQALIDQQTEITIPLIDSLRGTGSTTQARVVGFAGFVITRARYNGSSSQVFVEGYYTQKTCTSQCVNRSMPPTGLSGQGGMMKLRLIG